MGKLDLKSTRIYENTMGDILCAFTHLGEEVYLSDDKSFNTFTKGKLIGVSYICGVNDNAWTKYPFVGNSVGDDGLEKSAHYKYFILAVTAKFKETELKPFRYMSEFLDKTCFKVGEVITIKRFGDQEYEETCVFSGFRIVANTEPRITTVVFGNDRYTFEELKNCFKYHKNGKWLPFGIEE